MGPSLEPNVFALLHDLLSLLVVQFDFFINDCLNEFDLVVKDLVLSLEGGEHELLAHGV